jgi:type IV pilus assembly protein PilP
MRKIIFFIFGSFVLGSGLLLAQAPSLPPPSAEANAAAPSPQVGSPQVMQIDGIGTISNAEGYQYEPTGRRDPFKPFGESQATLAPEIIEQLETEKPKEPLEAYDIAQFKLVGIIWNVNDPKAVVRDPGGKVHTIRKETKMGRNNGFVAAIREGEVIIVEPAVSEGGMQTAITRVLNLKR